MAREKSSVSGTSTRGKNRRGVGSQFVVCVNNVSYPASLELDKICRILADDEAAPEGDIRVIDESGEDYLHRAEWFVRVEVPQILRNSLLRAP